MQNLIDEVDKNLRRYRNALDALSACHELIDSIKCFVDVRGPQPEYTNAMHSLLTNSINMTVQLEEATAELFELQNKWEEEHDNPTCALCGEKQRVRTGVDTEGTHDCIGG